MNQRTFDPETLVQFSDTKATVTEISITEHTSIAVWEGIGSSCDPTGKDVWFTYTSGPDAGTLSLDTCGVGFDTVISLYSNCSGLPASFIACNDDATGVPCSGPASAISLPMLAGQTVKIRVSDKNTAGGPFTMNWSSMASARVASEPRSLPAPGSENNWHHTRSPVRVAFRSSAFWASVPKAKMPCPASTSPTMLSIGGTPARAHSTIHAPVCAVVRPRPPYSDGQ